MVKLSGKRSFLLSARVAKDRLSPDWIVSNVKTSMAVAETARQDNIRQYIMVTHAGHPTGIPRDGKQDVL